MNVRNPLGFRNVSKNMESLEDYFEVQQNSLTLFIFKPIHFFQMFPFNTHLKKPKNKRKQISSSDEF